ncbi:glycosyltransferase [Caldibacillus debilis]|uniref:Glycosyltransferase n=1 Tax=Caldibacillus debilis GB1 TaxID=1339248 RepID=A0A420VHG1_9BACI|nr:glycosyltransferase [Caldibacillus debilis]RKO63035.1 Glycosyltransferase [Caldibacillus debilis GB1]
MKHVFMLINDIDVGRGGLTRVMLERASYLSEKGYKCALLTIDYKDRYDLIHKELVETNRLSENVPILNVYDYYSQKNTIKDTIEPDLSVQKIEEDNYYMQLNQLSSHRHVRYFDENGKYVMYKRWHPNGHLEFLDLFREDRTRKCKIEFDHKKFKRRTIFFDPLGRKKQELYHTPDGFTYLNVDFNVETGKPQMIFLFHRNKKEVTHFGTSNPMLQFHKYWLEELAKETGEKPVIINDGIFLTHTLLAVDPNLAYRVATIHTNHFDSPYTEGAPLRKSHEHLLYNYDKLDAIVFLTKKQRKMVLKQFGNYNNDYVIPNALSNLTPTGIRKDYNKISIVGRLDPNKNIQDAILSFKLIKDRHPNAKLYIYGEGKEKDALLELIKNEGLEDRVFLQGYTNEVGKVFEESLFTLVTSKFEGFCLVITESMMMKTPVISYDCNFGPSDIINHKVDGFLVEKGNREKMAKYMDYLLSHPEKAIKMGEKAKQNVEKRFNKEVVYSNWIKLFNDIEKKNAKKN